MPVKERRRKEKEKKTLVNITCNTHTQMDRILGGHCTMSLLVVPVTWVVSRPGDGWRLSKSPPGDDEHLLFGAHCVSLSRPSHAVFPTMSSVETTRVLPVRPKNQNFHTQLRTCPQRRERGTSWNEGLHCGCHCCCHCGCCHCHCCGCSWRRRRKRRKRRKTRRWRK